MNLEPFGPFVAGRPRIGLVGAEVPHARRRDAVAVPQLSLEHIRDLGRAVPMRSYSLARTDDLVKDRELGRRQDGRGEKVTAEELEELGRLFVVKLLLLDHL